jgi:MFS family permease
MNSLKLILTHLNYFAPVWVFTSLNMVTGTWVLYIPYVKTKFGLNDGQIGLALFCLALGILVAIPLVPIITKKLGVGRATFLGILMYALVFNLPLLASSFTLLGISLFFAGIFSGFTDVVLNALIVTIENKDKINFMSAAHGFFSLGGFFGAGIGSILIGVIATPFWHMFIIFSFVVLTNLVLARHYYYIKDIPISSKEGDGGMKKLRPLFVLAVVTFFIMFNEGAVEHWSNLFLFDVVNVSESIAAMGFVAFSLCMTLGRFLGDGISEKQGPIKVIIYGCLIALSSYALILTSTLFISVLGFGLLGLGLSVIIPELFRLAGRTKNIPSSVSISFVSGVGFLGFLVGPVIIGFISNISSLIISYVFLAVLILITIVLTYFKLKPTFKS